MRVPATFAIFALTFGTAVSAQNSTDPARLYGWWRGVATHNGESKDMYLHFDEYKGKPLVKFSIPWIAADDSPLGPYKIEANKVTFPAAGWSLMLDDTATAMAGTIPPDILPVYNFPVRFERSAPPEKPSIAPPDGPPPRPIWQRRLDGAVFGPLAFDEATRSVIVTTDSGTVSALAGTSGKPRWSAKLGAPIRAAATVASDGIYVATDAGVSKLRKRDGKPIWTSAFTGKIIPRKGIKEPDSRWDDYGSAVVLSDGLAVAGSRDGCVYAFHQRDGQVQQRICSKDVITSTPVIHSGRVYFSSFDNQLYAADLKTGDIHWKADLNAPAPGDLALVDGRIVAGSRSYDLTAHDLGTGKVGWTNYFWFSWIDSHPVEDRGQLLIGSSDALRVFALDPKSGRTLWSSFLGGWAWARPAADEHTVYAGAVGAVTFPYIGPRIGGLAAVNRTDGRLKWVLRPAHDPKAAIAGFAAGPVVVEGRVYAADLEGNVYALPAD